MMLYHVILSHEAGGNGERVGQGKLRKEERRENELPMLWYVDRAE